MRSIRFRCPHCRRKMEVSAKGAGLRVSCPDCANIVRIPARSEKPRFVLKQGKDDSSEARTITITVSAKAVLRRRIVAGLGFLVLAIGAYILVRLPGQPLAAMPFLALSMGLGIVSIVQRVVLPGVIVLICSVGVLQYAVVRHLAVSKNAAFVKEPGAEAAPVQSQEHIAVSPPVESTEPSTGGYEIKELPAPAPRSSTPTVATRPEPGAGAPPEIAPAARTRATPGTNRLSVLANQIGPDGKVKFPFRLYGDCDDGNLPYYPYGWMGSVEDIELNECWESGSYVGSSCIMFSYKGKRNWAGVAWQDPPNNWGDVPGGYDLTGAKRLTFWARGETGFEIVEFKVGLLGVSKKYFDTAKATLGKVQLHRQWTPYAISVQGLDLSRIVTAFVWIVEGVNRPITFYVDEVQFEE